MNETRSSDTSNAPDSPAKRIKGNDGQWRHSGWLSTNTPSFSQMDRTTAYDAIIEDSIRKQSTALERQQSTPTRTFTYFDLVQDALVANPEGLSSNDVFEWLRAHRPHVFRQYNEKKLRVAIQGSLSAQSNRQQPTVWKYKVDGSEGPGYIWKLASAVSSVEAASAREIPQFPLAVNCGGDGAEASHEDARAPVSPNHYSQRAQVGSVSHATLQEHDDRNAKGTQTPKAEGATLHGNEEFQHAVGGTNHNAGNIAKKLPRKTSEPLATSQFKSTIPAQPRAHTQDEGDSETAITKPGATASREARAQRQCDVSENSRDSDDEEQLRYGKLVSKIRRMRDRREHQIQRIEADRKALPELKILEKNVKEAAERVTELRRLLEEACRSAETARSDLEVTTNKINEIATAEREVEQLITDSKELRDQLGID